MTPSQKANELISKYLKIDTKKEWVSIYIAKEFTLITIDEQLKNINVDNPLEEGKLNYWLDVRLEIEKL